MMRHAGERVALALEVVENHAHDRSRFLRGVAVDEDKIVPADAAAIEPELPELVYVNPASTRFHLLDKVLSLDDAQEAVYRLAPPLILIGSAGSGRTALALEKLMYAPQRDHVVQEWGWDRGGQWLRRRRAGELRRRRPWASAHFAARAESMSFRSAGPSL